MKTINITLPTKGWLDVAELANITFTIDKSYTISARGGLKSEICIASEVPENDFIGHPLSTEENFLYTPEAADEKLYVKTDIIGTILVVS